MIIGTYSNILYCYNKSYVSVVSAVSPICCFKYPYSRFFLTFLLPSFYWFCVCSYVSIIVTGRCNYSFFGLFNVILEPLYCSIYTIPNPGKSNLTFYSTHVDSMLSPGSKALCIVKSFLVLSCIWMSSSLVYFKNCPEYLTRETTHVFIPFIRFQLQFLVSRSFLVLLR